MAQETLRLASPAIAHGGRLPRKYTGGGQSAVKDVSPPLEWYGVPEAARSLALVVEDVDAPADADSPVVPWTHWVVVNIPPMARGLPEGFSGKEEAAVGEHAGIKEGQQRLEGPRLAWPQAARLRQPHFLQALRPRPTPASRQQDDEGKASGFHERACGWRSRTDSHLLVPHGRISFLFNFVCLC